MQALWRYLRRIRRSRLGRRRYIGSVPGRRMNKHRDFRSGLRAIVRDYFGLDGSPPAYDEANFKRRFRVPRSEFLRINHAVKGRPFFVQRINATGRPQADPLQKVVAAFREISYGETPDLTDEYGRLSASTIAMSVRELLRFIVDELVRHICVPPHQPSCSVFWSAMRNGDCPGVWERWTAAIGSGRTAPRRLPACNRIGTANAMW